MKILIVAPEQIPVPGTGSVEICKPLQKKLAEHHQVTVVSRALGNLASHSKVVDGVNIFNLQSLTFVPKAQGVQNSLKHADIYYCRQ